MTYRILEPIISNFKKKTYANTGDECKLISIHGEILILEGKERFPVHKDKVKEV